MRHARGGPSRRAGGRAGSPYIQRMSGDSPFANTGLWLEKKVWKWPLDQRERCWKQLRTCGRAGKARGARRGGLVWVLGLLLFQTRARPQRRCPALPSGPLAPPRAPLQWPGTPTHSWRAGGGASKRRGEEQEGQEGCASLGRRAGTSTSRQHQREPSRRPPARKQRQSRAAATDRHCQLSFFSSMPSAKSSVSVHSGNRPACGGRGRARASGQAGRRQEGAPAMEAAVEAHTLVHSIARHRQAPAPAPVLPQRCPSGPPAARLHKGAGANEEVGAGAGDEAQRVVPRLRVVPEVNVGVLRMRWEGGAGGAGVRRYGMREAPRLCKQASPGITAVRQAGQAPGASR